MESTEERYTLASKTCAGFKKVLNGHQLYREGHATLAAFHRALFGHLEEFLAGDESMVLSVSPYEMVLEDQTVFVDEDGDQAITKTLFLDGIRKIVFRPGLTADELDRFLTIWFEFYAGLVGDDHTVSTRLWEADLKTIEVVCVSIFTETGDVSADEDKEAEEEHGDELKALMEQFGTEQLDALAGGIPVSEHFVDVPVEEVVGTLDDLARQGSGGQTIQVSAADTRILRIGALRGLTGEDLKRQDNAERPPVQGLGDSERLEIARQLATYKGQRAESAILDLALLAAGARDQEERGRIVGILERILGGARHAEQFEAIRRALETLIAAAHEQQRHRPALDELMTCFSSPQVLGTIIPLLDDPDARDVTSGLLRRLPPLLIGALVPHIPELASEDGRELLIRIIALRTPDLDAIVEQLPQFEPAIATQVLEVMRATSPSYSRTLCASALAHTDADVRRAALAGIDKDDLGDGVNLTSLIAAPQPDIRRAAIDLLVRAKHEPAGPHLLKLLADDSIDDEERLFLIRAIERFDLDDARVVLRRHFETSRNVDVRIACAGSLGRAGDELARPALKAAARKFLGKPRLKKACRKALKALDQRKAARRRGERP